MYLFLRPRKGRCKSNGSLSKQLHGSKRARHNNRLQTLGKSKITSPSPLTSCSTHHNPKVHSSPTPVRTVTEAATHGPFDYILVCSKAFPGTSALIKDAVTPAVTSIILAQNGIGIEEEYHTAYPENTIISGVLYLPTTQTSPGYVSMGPLELFQIGVYPTPSTPPTPSQQSSIEATETFASLFTKGGATCTIHADVQKPRWIKLSANAAWNSMCALTHCDDANLLRSSPGAMHQIRKIMKEVAVLADGVGYPGTITDAEIDKILERMALRKSLFSLAFYTHTHTHTHRHKYECAVFFVIFSLVESQAIKTTDTHHRY